MFLPTNKCCLIFLLFIVPSLWRINTHCASISDDNAENNTEKYDYLNPILRNPRIQPHTKRRYFLIADNPEYAECSEVEYLDKLKQGLLTEEEILYPVLPAVNHEWQETMASDLAERMKNLAMITHSEPYVFPDKATSKFEIEETSDTNRPTVPLYIDDNNCEHEYHELCIKLHTWAKNFEEEALEEVKQRSEFNFYRFLPLDYFAIAPIYQALEAREFSWIKKILIITDSYDYTKAFDISIRIASNMNGYWGPVIVLKINPRIFMNETTKPNECDIALQIVTTALTYYCK